MRARLQSGQQHKMSTEKARLKENTTDYVMLN